MKTLKQTSILFLLVTQICLAQWYPQSSGTTNGLYSVCFTDSNNGTAVGGQGIILRTTNGGTTWTSQTSGTENYLYGISFTDANNGTAVGDYGTILRTTNGGVNWISQTNGTARTLLSISFTDTNTGTAVGDYGGGGGGYEIIIRTTDGGQNWITQTSGTTRTLWGVFFTDSDNGTAVGGQGIILRTTNGGTTWTSQISGTGNDLYSVSFTDINTGTAVGGQGIILRTTNGGTTWASQTSGTGNYLYGVSFTDANNGIALGSYGTIIKTSDGGINWELQSSGITETLIGVCFIDLYNGWAVGEEGRILKYSPLVWTNQIIIEDAGGIESSKALTIGQDPYATDSIDASLGEYALPPSPPIGIFDSRFNLPTLPQVGSFKDVRHSYQTEITWIMTFQPSSAGYPMTFSWDSTSFPDGTFYLKDLVNGSFVFVNMKEQSSYTLTEPAITSLNISYRGLYDTMSVNNEWNIISVPLLVEDMSLSNVFPTASSLAYGFERGYVTEDTLVGGKGYWLKFGGNEDIQVCGSLQGDTVSLKEGWNMFGVYENDIPVSQMTATPPGIVATYFFGFIDGYYIAYALQSGKGYWVRVTEDGVLNLKGSKLEKDGEQKQFAEIYKDWGRVIFTDNEGKSITLFASEDEKGSNLYELPPIPPTGIFDVRFSSGKFVEYLSNGKTIQISSDQYPINIKAEGINLTVRDRINGEILNQELSDGQELRITNNKVTSIEVSGRITGALPVSYELYQNYPNPFNPSTKIKFSLPEDVGNVKLSIYNALGEKVAELVNSSLAAGRYSYQWNAKNVATGMYIYELRTEKFLSIKKMLLLK